MPRFRSFIKNLPGVGPAVTFAYRLTTALGYYTTPLAEAIVWAFKSRETTNFTYDLTDLNRQYLVSLLADILGQSREQIGVYVSEIENDTVLRTHVQRVTKDHEAGRYADTAARYGRRVGWYAVARAMKPRVIVESGVDKGLGACVLTAALRKNAEEGKPGYYYGLDINPRAGYLLCGQYAQYGELRYGASLDSLRHFDHAIDLFINDSDHTACYETEEYQAVADKLGPAAIILGDNAHSTGSLLEFARTTDRQFVFFQERPEKHWYPGGGIGIAFRRSQRFWADLSVHDADRRERRG